jgi:hypothetical protein
MTYRVCVFACGAFLASLNFAAAQTSTAAIVNEGGASASANDAPRHVRPSATPGDTSRPIRPAGTFVPKVGWNAVHATNCTATLGAKNVVTVTLYPSEGGYFSTVLPQLQAIMIAQCSHGNWISMYISKLLGGGKFTWTQAQSWDYNN